MYRRVNSAGLRCSNFVHSWKRLIFRPGPWPAPERWALSPWAREYQSDKIVYANNVIYGGHFALGGWCVNSSSHSCRWFVPMWLAPKQNPGHQGSSVSLDGNALQVVTLHCQECVHVTILGEDTTCLCLISPGLLPCAFSFCWF